MSDAPVNRRPMSLRSHAWLRRLAHGAAACGITPNAVSLASIAFALAGAALLLGSRFTLLPVSALLLLLAPVAIALRGLCNLIDGMIAIEGGRRTPTGELFNDAPDRVADVMLFVAAGYAAFESVWAVPLGWAAAVLSVGTAYVRMLGGAIGARQYFSGPMAKPQRMAVLAAASVLAAGERVLYDSSLGLVLGLAVIAAGCVVTIGRRLGAIVRELEGS